jgi:hypothetical protein
LSEDAQTIGKFDPFFISSAALAIPAFAQTEPPMARRLEGSASIPDFSGMWVHPYFPGIEPPASGPGDLQQVTPTERYAE